MISLKDVARKAEVALSTASLALNNRSRVSPDTRQKVLDAARSLRYYPHHIARSLKSRRTDAVGFLMGGFGGPVYAELVQSAHDVLAEHGLDMVVCFSPSFGRLTQGRMLDGAIVLDAPTPVSALRRISSQGIPLVVMDRQSFDSNVHAVLLENEAGCQAMAEHLLALGYRDLLFVGGPRDSYDARRRLAGFTAALAAAGIRKVRHAVTDFTEAGGYQAIRDALASGAPPRAVCCANDETAIGALQALAERGLRVPEEVAVTGFDDIELSRYTSPRLTTVRVPRGHWGGQAAEALVAALQGRSPARQTKIAVELVVRESCGGTPAKAEEGRGEGHHG